MMSDHTPGPWIRLSGGILTTTALADHSSPDKLIGIWRHEPNEANACLIAAAPETIAALEDCVELLEFIHDNMGKHRCTVDCPDIGKRVRRGRDVIANATGKKPYKPHCTKQGWRA